MCNPDLAVGGAVILIQATVKEVAAGTNHALFLTDTGEVWSLGANSAGQGGLGTTSVQECPHVISSTSVRGASQLAAGQENSLALVEGTLSFTPTKVDFGNQPVGANSPSPMDIIITNTGLAPVTFYDINMSIVGDYSLSEDCPDNPGVLAAGANCKIKVNFAPTAPGQRDGRIKLVDDGRGRPQEIALTGIGTEARIAFSPATINFGTQNVGTTSSPQTVTIRNDGTALLLINTIATTTGFSIAADLCPRAPNTIPIQGTCKVDIVFAPNGVGPAVGDLRVTYEPSSKVATMRLEGTGN
jgi:hypothetical protein